MSAKVSVIVPCYNHAAYLDERLQSIFAQTYQDFELILLDDASTDHSASILNQYAKHPKVKTVIINTLNSGSTFMQWQRGIELATGDYIWIAESDDKSAPEFLEILINILENQLDIGLAYSQSYRINSQSEIIGDFEHYYADLSSDKWKSDYINDGKNEIISSFIIKNIIPNVSAVVFRNNADTQSAIKNINYRLSGDWLFYTRILERSKIYHCSKKLNFQRFSDLTVRARSGKNLIFFKEKISIQKYLVDKYKIGYFVRNKIFQYLLEDWVVYNQNTQKQSLSWFGNLQLFFILLQNRPKRVGQILRYFFRIQIIKCYKKSFYP